MADYPRIIKEEDVTNEKSRILLLTLMAMNNDEPSGKTKNKTYSSSHYNINYNVDTITETGLFRLAKGFYNFDDTGCTSTGKDIEWLYVVKYSDAVIRQFYLSAIDGHVTLTTRIRYKNVWRKWRTPSWLLPKYELVKNVRVFKNMHYISFGDYNITLPPASEFNNGDCVRLDQYEGIGKVTCGSEEVATHSTSCTDRFQSNLNCEGFEPTTYFSYYSFYTWKSNTDHKLTTIFNTTKDKFYWCIKDSTDKVLYTSVNDISTAVHPCDETTWLDESSVEHTIKFTVSNIVSDKEMESCTTYIFEVCNDRVSSRASIKEMEYYRPYNYWTLISGSSSRNTRERLQSYIQEGFSSIKKDISDLHVRTTTEVATLNTRIDNEVVALNTRINNEVTTLNKRIDDEVAALQTQIDFYHNINWIEINTSDTVISSTDLFEVLTNGPSCKYLVSSTNNTISFPDIDVAYIEGSVIPEQAAKLNTILNKSIQISVLASGGCNFNNLPLTCKVAANQTATAQLVKYQTTSNSVIINHYEWLFTLQKQS